MSQPEHSRSESATSAFRLGDELRGERATLGKSLLDVQRELRIKAAYIAAIENCDPSVFPNPSFIAGYVRSYARYLRRDPDEVYRRFCEESGFAGPHAAGAARQDTPRPGAAAATGGRRAGQPQFTPTLPFAPPRRALPEIPLAAIGSLLVLLALIAGIGYGGWTILQNIQRVEFAPVEEVPVAFADVAPLEPPQAGAGPALPDLAAPVAGSALVDLYRQQELEVPILVPRDGPIGAIDPDSVGLLARARPETAAVASLGTYGAEADGEAAAPEGEALPNEPQVTTTPERHVLTVVAERPAWIRVYFPNGTIIFERILESGELYEVPETAEPPLIWAGNSGSVYVRIDDTLHGPIGRGTRAARDVPLEAEAIMERFGVVDEVPSVISDAFSSVVGQSGTLVQ